jgi:signal transduction histidine kinase
VRGTLLGTYTVLILLAFAVLATAFSLIHGNRVRSEVLNTLSQQAQSMAAAADREIDQMRTMAMNITYSTRLQDRLYLRQGTSGGLSDEADRLSMILSLIVFPNRPIDQINLYTRDGIRISSGMDNEITRDGAETKPWYGPLSEQENAQLLFYSGRDEKLSKYVTDAYGKEFVTLVLENYDNFGTRCGYIEIRQRISRILSAMMAYRPGFGESVFFFDREGKQIFPAAEEEPLFALAADRGFPGAFTAAGDGRLLCCVPAGRGQFYTVMSIREADLFRSVRDQIVTILLITLGALVVTVLASGLVSRRITRPLADICDQVGRIELEHPEPLPAVDSDIREIQTLHTSFSRMQETLSGHVAKLLELQNQEMQSRMLALQAQMNPHFLFNSIQAIQAMADEGMDAEIAEMCQSMAGILRYISSDSAQLVPLEKEIRHTKDYLRCMEIRYQGDLACEVSLPPEMDPVPVPKLCVQLLAENAIKFTTTRRPPYRIRIEGTVSGDSYELRIRDNGPGFDPETRAALTAQMEEIRRTATLPSLKIQGMGILHVYIRFFLLYGEDFVFRLENNPEGGACVVIGGKWHGQAV